MPVAKNPNNANNIQRFARDYVNTARRNDQLVQVVSVLILSHILRHLETNYSSFSSSHPRKTRLEQDREKPIAGLKETDAETWNQYGPGLFRLQNLVRKSFEGQDTETVWENLAAWLVEHLALQALNEGECQPPPRPALSQLGLMRASKRWLEERIDRLFTIYSRGLARTVVQALDLYSLNETQITEMINFYPNQVQPGGRLSPDLPLLIAPMGMFPSHPIVQSLVASVQAVGTKQWTDMPDGACWHEYREGRKARIDVIFHPLSEAEKRLLGDHVCHYQDLVVDVLLMILGHWMFQAKSPDSLTWISVDALLKYRGIKSKMKNGQAAGYRFGERDLISHSILFLQRLTIQVQGLTGYPVQEKPGPINARGRMLHVEGVWHRKNASSVQQIAAIYYNPGEMGRFFLNEYRAQLAFIPRQVFSYDYYRQNWEKRLGRYLFFQWAIRKNHGNLDRPWRVLTILNNLHKHPDASRPERTRKRLEKALTRLQADGLIGTWSYTDGDDQSLPAHNWLGTWLQWKVHITPPAMVWQAYPSIRRP